MKTKLSLAFFFVFYFLQAQSTSDSLYTALSKTNNDTAKARIYIRLVDYYQQSNPNKALKLASEGLQFVKKLNWTKGYAVYYNDIGSTYLAQTKYKEALLYFTKSLRYSQDFPPIKANALHNIVIVHINQENVKLAEKYNSELYSLAKKNNLKSDLGLSFSNYGTIYEIKKDSAKAKLFYLKSLALIKETKDSIQLATVLMNLGDLSNDITTKIDYYNQSKKIWDSVEPNHLVAISNNMSLAEEYLKIAKNDYLFDKTKISLSKTELLNKVSALLLNAVKQCVATNKQQNLMYAYGKLSELEEFRCNYKKALEYNKLNTKINNTIFSQENKNKIAQIENQKIVDLKNQQIQLKEKEKKNQKIYFSIGLLLFSIIAALLYYQNQNRKKTNSKLLHLIKELDLKNEELDKANKNKTKFIGILNHDLRSPVSNLIDFLHLQKNNPELLDENLKNKYQEATIKNAENLLVSMEDLLLWTKSQMKTFEPKIQLVSLQTIFEETCHYFQFTKNIQFSIENPENLHINTDSDYLKTITRNITSNAIKSLEKSQKPQIVWHIEKEKSQTILSISDNGHGMNEEKLKTILNQNQNTNIKTGLGMLLIKDLAAIINCKVNVTSQENIGTTYTLTF